MRYILLGATAAGLYTVIRAAHYLGQVYYERPGEYR